MADTTIFTDGIRNVSLSNGVLRVELARLGPQSQGNQQQESAGVLLVPANQAANFANSLNSALRDLQQKIQQQQQEQEQANTEPEGAGPNQ